MHGPGCGTWRPPISKKPTSCRALVQPGHSTCTRYCACGCVTTMDTGRPASSWSKSLTIRMIPAPGRRRKSPAPACWSPNAALAPDRLVLLTQRAVDSGKSVLRVASLATALYRAGQYDLALELLKETKAANSPAELTWADSIEAMSHHRRGEPVLARAALQSAARSVGQQTSIAVGSSGATPSATWWIEVQGDLFFREATILIEGKAPQEDPQEWTGRGLVLEQFGRIDDAITSYSRAIELFA